MFHMFWGVIGMAITAVAGLFAFGVAREYVRTKLRYVDAVHNPVTPWIVGVGAFVIAIPIVAILAFLHLVSGGTALIFGAAAGLGTASGVKALKRGD